MSSHSSDLSEQRNAGKAVHLSSNSAVSILKACRSKAPLEACGLLVGRVSGQGVEVLDAVPTQNISLEDQRSSFAMDPKEQFDLQRRLRVDKTDLAVVGHFHSHPEAAAVPSASDLSWASDPNALWIIVGGAMDRMECIRAFLPTVQGFEELDVLTDYSDRETSVPP